MIDFSEKDESRAVVIGGGIAGLVAARVLIKHFKSIVIIERDIFPDEPVFRPRVPQGRHAHVMLLRGQRILEQMFPGLSQKLFDYGAVELDFINDVPSFIEAGQGLSFHVK